MAIYLHTLHTARLIETGDLGMDLHIYWAINATLQCSNQKYLPRSRCLRDVKVEYGW
jgi:hypothetical protein